MPIQPDSQTAMVMNDKRMRVTHQTNKPDFYTFLKEVHRRDYSREAVEQRKLDEDCLHPTPSFGEWLRRFSANAR
ncbi:hypothetical protein ASPCAL08818 [Aspergillus calidoustus]|uniref:Uncharacterized protein n=1 Tax=Aspergillus calidoustus TaxID=454130 RepID=A0A0U5GTR8_ASPCI|nr:hypothetical protein ASPCAL08818 [Aspergillus calidoustus]